MTSCGTDKYFGVYIDEVHMSTNVATIVRKVYNSIKLNKLSKQIRVRCYQTHVKSILEYANSEKDQPAQIFVIWRQFSILDAIRQTVL